MVNKKCSCGYVNPGPTFHVKCLNCLKTLTTTFEVTATHISAGGRSRCRECPIALAVIEATGLKCRLLLEHISAEIEAVIDWDTGGVTKLPRACRDFIMAFDHEKPVEPFQFEVPDADIQRAREGKAKSV